MNMYIGIIRPDGTFKVESYDKSLDAFKGEPFYGIVAQQVGSVIFSCDEGDVVSICEELGLVYED